MSLAGNMKQSTFLTLAGCVGALGIAGFFLFKGEKEPEAEPVLPVVQAPVVAERVEEPVPPKATQPDAKGGPWGADASVAIRSVAELSPVAGKAKDLSGGSGVKVNVYRDEGEAENNRAKLDIDRDDKWDIKLDFEPGRVVATYAPQDDEDYSETWVSMAGGVWLQEGVEDAQQEVIAAELPNMDPVDVALIKWQGKDLGTKKIKDATKGQPFKINVYQDDGNPTANRAKIDLDRDDKWDIKVTFEEPATRQVSPDDDENYSVTQAWTGQGWE
jgi:hypothetical protein